MDKDDVKEEIKRRADLAALISQYVPLQRAGQRLRARCPFHQEKTPSFYVDPAGGFWKCFGCGAGGDIFSFLQKIEGLTFPEAAERLARQVGLEWDARPVDTAKAQRRRSLQETLELGAQFFEAQLKAPVGAVAREYLERRGLLPETVKTFRLGFAPPGWENLGRELANAKVPAALAQESGLIRARNSGGYYDVFRDRVMFPIVDAAGHTLGFGGRTLDPEEQAKYLNSADTPLFKKGQQVYGLPQARQAMGAAGYVVLVEGYTDVLALHQAGFAPVVAALGTALTEDHVRLLGRYVETVILCYDADSAGQQAALRNLEIFERLAVEAQILVLPAGQDPDEFIRAQGLPAWEKLLQSRLSLAEFQIKMVFDRYRGQGPDGLAKAAGHAVEVLARVRERIKRDDLVARAADRWGEGHPGRTAGMQRSLLQALARRGPAGAGPRPDRGGRRTDFIADTLSRVGEGPSPWRHSVESELLTLALQDESWSRRLEEMVSLEDFTGPHRLILETLWAQRRGGEAYAPDAVIESLPEEDGCRARGVELLLTPLSPPTEEVILGCIAKLRRHSTADGVEEKYELPAAEPQPDAEPVVPSGETFAELRDRVIAAVSRGEMTREDPDYQTYYRLATKFHGRGQYDYVLPSGPLSAGPPRDGESPVTEEEGS
ncbi:MAG TPA: DNA primase [Armatimonadota bacterium]|jgi:DNA primase